MWQYLDLLKECVYGEEKDDRTGTGTTSVFGYQMRFNLQDGFPLLTTKKLHLKSIIYELLWMISGETNILDLQENGVTIWDEWADENGDLGPVYGQQWRHWPVYNEIEDGLFTQRREIDQLQRVIRDLRKNPNSRRHIVTAWNPVDLDDMALPPCHCFFQFYANNGKLSCQMYQRSADVFLGVPFNIATYSLLTMMVAQICELQPYEFIHTFGDVHLYKNHFSQAITQLLRTPRALPKMRINPDIQDIDDFKYEDFELAGYDPYPHIKAEVSV